MSWSVEGRMYHDYTEYQQARARAMERRLRQAVQLLRIPAADTSRVEQQIAAGQARDHALRRLAAQVRSATADRQAMAEAHRERIGEAFREVEREEERLHAELSGHQHDLERGLQALEQEREAQAAAVAANLEREVAGDRRDDETARRRQQDLVARAQAVLDGLAAADLPALGLDASPVRGLVERARGEGGAAGLELARRACDQASGLDSDAAYRQARLAALREVYAAEVASLRQALRFAGDDRVDLVGEGEAALDAPLAQELERLGERLAGVRRYEDHEARFAELGKVLDHLSVRVGDLAAQVQDFDRLEGNRLDLVRHRLGGELTKALGQEVQLLEVTPGALGLQPVEARFRTANGEKVDCSVYIDGSLRIHHYEHVSQASCAESARALAQHLPALMATTGQPSLDVVAAGAQPGAAADAADASARTERSSS
jgi:hypothetical protein